MILFSFCIRIDELVRGDGPVHYQGYGDPTMLNSVKLNDLHPRSWLVEQYFITCSNSIIWHLQYALVVSVLCLNRDCDFVSSL